MPTVKDAYRGFCEVAKGERAGEQAAAVVAQGCRECRCRADGRRRRVGRVSYAMGFVARWGREVHFGVGRYYSVRRSAIATCFASAVCASAIDLARKNASALKISPSRVL